MVVPILAYAVWLCRPFLPDPLALMRRPGSTVSAVSGPREWRVFGHSPAHNRFLPDAASVAGRVRWSRHLGEPTDSAPSVADGVVYVGGAFRIHALEAASGKTVWEAATTGPVHATAALAGPLAFFGLLDGRVMALDRSNGSVRWTFQTANYVFVSPCVVDGILYTGSGDKAVYALDALTGRLVWKTRTGGGIIAAPAVADGILYASTDHRSLLSLSARTGARRLRFRVYRDLVDTPVVGAGLVYLVCRDGRLYTIRHGAREIPGRYEVNWMWAQFWLWRLPVPRPPPQTGSVWRVSPPNPQKGFTASPALAPEMFYIGDRQGRFSARDPAAGAVVWEFQAEGPITSSPVVLGEQVCFGDEQGGLYLLDRFEGRLLWKVSLGAPIKVSPVLGAELLFVRTADGRLHALE